MVCLALRCPRLNPTLHKKRKEKKKDVIRPYAIYKKQLKMDERFKNLTMEARGNQTAGGCAPTIRRFPPRVSADVDSKAQVTKAAEEPDYIR